MLEIRDCRITDEFVFFYDSVFSQWADCHFIDYSTDEAVYDSAERYMMRQKALLFNDDETAEKIMSAISPSMCKILGKKVKNFTPEKWIQHRISIVTKGNYLKFSQDLTLKNILMSTGDRILVEASPYDKVWGIQMDQESPDIENADNWKGLNLLGVCLMSVRSHFKLIDNILDPWRQYAK